MNPLHYSQFVVRPVPLAPGRRFRAYLYVGPDENTSSPPSGVHVFPWCADPGAANAAAMAYVKEHLDEESAWGRYIGLQLVYVDHG